MLEQIILLEGIAEIDRVFTIKSIRLFKIGSKRVAVVKAGNLFYAFDNNCPHADQPLHEGIISPANEIVCPWHNYRFDLRSGHESSLRCKDLILYKIMINEKDQLVLEAETK